VLALVLRKLKRRDEESTGSVAWGAQTTLFLIKLSTFFLSKGAPKKPGFDGNMGGDALV
jgi:hypothetical protein